MVLSDPRHPIWSLLRMVTMTGAAVAILHVTAAHFDAGELKAAGVVGGSSLAFDLVKRMLAKEG